MVLATLAFSSWWLTHTILDTSRTERVTRAVLDDVPMRSYIAGKLAPVVSQAVGAMSLNTAIDTSPGPPSASSAPTAPADTSALEDRLVTVLNDPSVRSQLEGFIVEVHRGLLGEDQGPAVLDKSTVNVLVAAAVPTMTSQDLAKLPPVSVDVPSQPLLHAGSRFLQGRFWQFGLGAIALLALAIGVSRDRRSAVKLIGKWLLGISLGHLVVMWIIPVIIVPRLSDSPWTSLIEHVARAFAGGVVVGLTVLVIAGLACLLVDRLIPQPANS